jgi:hypothetical protein
MEEEDVVPKAAAPSPTKIPQEGITAAAGGLTFNMQVHIIWHAFATLLTCGVACIEWVCAG